MDKLEDKLEKLDVARNATYDAEKERLAVDVLSKKHCSDTREALNELLGIKLANPTGDSIPDFSLCAHVAHRNDKPVVVVDGDYKMLLTWLEAKPFNGTVEHLNDDDVHGRVNVPVPVKVNDTVELLRSLAEQFGWTFNFAEPMQPATGSPPPAASAANSAPPSTPATDKSGAARRKAPATAGSSANS